MSAHRLRRAAVLGLGLAVAFAGFLGCGDPPQPQTKPQGPQKPAAGGGAPAASASAQAGRRDKDGGPPEGLAPLPLREFKEADFSETEQSRDPFRNFSTVFVNQAKSKQTVQRKAIVERYALDELKLIGIVSRGMSRALLTDPTGLGWVAKVGDLVGKPEVVHAGGPTGIDVALNWRVDRIRVNDVVFVREDPSHPEIPPTTRVIALRTPEEEANRLQQP